MGLIHSEIVEAEEDAKAGMKAANDALLRGDRKPTPRWVIQATEAGWTPPEGWKP